LAALGVVGELDEADIDRKGKLFRNRLRHPGIVSISGAGLLLAVEFASESVCREVIARCIAYGLMTDWFLFAPNRMRIAPPLIIQDHQIFMACDIILRAVSETFEPPPS
jgi:acetylornithine/succinyldiaminopimelate/putrescine aminotransferase